MNKIFKKSMVCLLIIALFLMSFVGCSKDLDDNSNNNTVRQEKTADSKEYEIKKENQKKQENNSNDKKTDKEDKKNKKEENKNNKKQSIEKDKAYISKDEGALYIHTFNSLPPNFVTKKEAQNAGWDSKEGNLNDVLPGKSIGGDRFGNREELLPTAKNRKYYECDINYTGGYRNGERIVYSNDGLIFYTGDHYKTFTKLY